MFRLHSTRLLRDPDGAEAQTGLLGLGAVVAADLTRP
jgi:hypothetical protein